MYSLLREQAYRKLACRQLPELVLAMIIAEAFYRFHSFTLESLAFLATWFAIDFVVDRAIRLLGYNRGTAFLEDRQ